MPQSKPDDVEQQIMSLIQSTGKKPTEIVSVGNSGKGTTVVVFVDEEDGTLGAEISEAGTRIFEIEDSNQKGRAMSQPSLEELQQIAISFIQDAGKNPTEIISIGPSSKGTTIVVFIDETGEKLLAEISDTDIQIFETND